jgi:sigma-E factor negative regulatory protein RseA
MSTPKSRPSVPPDLWSALADGEASGAEVQAALSDWRSASGAQATWHVYHLIGDTLRSSELASPRLRDDRLLRAVQDRLAGEPVVLAPSSSNAAPVVAVSSRHRVRLWSGAAAMAAGVGAVGVMVWLTQGPSASDAALAQRATPPVAVAPIAGERGAAVPVSVNAAGAAPAPLAVAGPMLRDARLDEYLAAHRQLGAGRPLGTPAGYAQPVPSAVAR